MPGTPILDLETPPPPLKSHWLALLLMAGIAGVLANVLPIQLDGLWALPMLYAGVAVHEVGHLLAARLVGMEAGGLVIGGLMILRSGDRWVTRFEWRRILSGGLAKPLPKRGEYTSARYLWMVAGGPIATLLLLAASGIACWQYGAAAPAWLSTLCWINVLLAFSCLVPYRIGLSRSDASWLLLQWRKPAESRSWAALLQVMAQETVGTRPRDWDAEAFAEMMAANSNRAESAARHMLAFYRRLDEGREADALDHLEGALAASGLCGRVVRQWCFLEASCSSAILRGKGEQARTWLVAARKVRRPESTRGPEAGIAMAEGRYQDALKLWDEALAFVARRKLDSGLVRFSKERMEFYRGQCRDRAAGPPETASA
ncbi:MAG TPA: M50 family metallopeptidase [Bryobacteraceae bacterium]|nr:M50 family metallopeptidase [Bryobacteraceae bacterium]